MTILKTIVDSPYNMWLASHWGVAAPCTEIRVYWSWPGIGSELVIYLGLMDLLFKLLARVRLSTPDTVLLISAIENKYKIRSQ